MSDGSRLTDVSKVLEANGLPFTPRSFHESMNGSIVNCLVEIRAIPGCMTLSNYDRCCIAAKSVCPTNQLTRSTFAEVQHAFAESCENAPTQISLTEDELASDEVVAISARKKVVFSSATRNHYEETLASLHRLIVSNHCHDHVDELLTYDWNAITVQLPDETPHAFLERVFALRRRIEMFAGLENDNLHNMPMCKGAVTHPLDPNRVVSVLAPSLPAVKEKVRLGIKHVDLTDKILAITNMDVFRRAVIKLCEANRARAAVQSIVRRPRASTHVHSFITADVSPERVDGGAITRTGKVCDFWKKKTCFFGDDCKYAHSGAGGCIPKPVGFSGGQASKRLQRPRKKIPQRPQESSVNLNSLSKTQLRQIASGYQATLLAMLQVDDKESDEGPGHLFMLDVDEDLCMLSYDGDPYSDTVPFGLHVAPTKLSIDSTFTSSAGLVKNKLTIAMSTDPKGSCIVYTVLDSGSDVNAVSGKLHELLRSEGVISDYVSLQGRKATAVNGSDVKCVASCCATLHIAENWKEKIPVVVVPDLELPFLIGRPQMQLWGLIINLATNKARFTKTMYKLEVDLANTKHRRGIG
mmetsp:Transcript_11768/g.35369  ORF Transcript_11768/g.35369 Transcript_11768/m.35369 type:complete len:582 (-) Transcript_11768:1664-3409(-)